MAFLKGHIPWNKGKHHSEETKRKLREHHKGMLGKHHTEEMKRKESKLRMGERNPMWKGGKKRYICKYCNKEFYSYPSKNQLYCSIKCSAVCPDRKKKKSKSATGKYGERSSNWKGGKTPLSNIIRSSFKYRQWISDIFTKNDFICQICRERGKRLEADHYPKKFSEILKEYKIKTLEEALNCEELWNINNGRTLCLNCHNILHHTKRKYDPKI